MSFKRFHHSVVVRTPSCTVSTEAFEQRPIFLTTSHDRDLVFNVGKVNTSLCDLFLGKLMALGSKEKEDEGVLLMSSGVLGKEFPLILRFS